MQFFHRHRLFRAVLALLLTGHVALASLMAVWQPLHHALHDCCGGDENHVCEVTLFAHGAVPQPAAPAELPAPAPAVSCPPAPTIRLVKTLTAAHFAGGILAQAPPRGP